jgi:hypothetical protein
LTINDRLDALAKHVNAMLECREGMILPTHDRAKVGVDDFLKGQEEFLLASQALSDLNMALCRKTADLTDSQRLSTVHPSWVRPKLLPPGTPDARD